MPPWRRPCPHGGQPCPYGRRACSYGRRPYPYGGRPYPARHDAICFGHDHHRPYRSTVLRFSLGSSVSNYFLPALLGEAQMSQFAARLSVSQGGRTDTLKAPIVPLPSALHPARSVPWATRERLDCHRHALRFDHWANCHFRTQIEEAAALRFIPFRADRECRP
jgi:hypothetical protein